MPETKILITGGAGFIGSHLAIALVNGGYRVSIIDDLSRGKYENLKSIHNKINFIKGELSEHSQLDDLIRASDIVFHLAALSRVIPSITNPELCFQSNVEGTEIVSRLCMLYNKRLIFSSSREVYGSAQYIPVDEKHALRPENPYGAYKLIGERIIESYSKYYGLRYAILRLANVYGNGDFDRVIPTFIENIRNNKDIIIYGGNQTLDFVYITDVIDAFLKVLTVQDNFTVNIGSGKGTSILELAGIIKKIMNDRGIIDVQDKRAGEVEMFISDISHCYDVLYWKPETSIIEGIKKMVNLK